MNKRVKKRLNQKPLGKNVESARQTHAESLNNSIRRGLGVDCQRKASLSQVHQTRWAKCTSCVSSTRTIANVLERIQEHGYGGLRIMLMARRGICVKGRAQTAGESQG